MQNKFERMEARSVKADTDLRAELEEMKRKMEQTKSDRSQQADEQRKELEEIKETMAEIKRLRRAADADIIANLKELIREEFQAFSYNGSSGGTGNEQVATAS